MVINKILDYVFSAQSNIKILRVLNDRNAGVSGREAARLTGLSLRAVQKTLVNLSKTGLLKIAEGKREHLFSVDREKYLVKELVEKIFETEREFNTSLLKQIRTKLKPYAASLVQFGSTARGEDTLKSDFDLCIVYDKDLSIIEEKVSEVRSALFKTYKITLAPFYISVVKFRQLARQSKPPVKNIIEEGRVIAGKSIKELLNG
jgi:predicted nucleotidyltransferase